MKRATRQVSGLAACWAAATSALRARIQGIWPRSRKRTEVSRVAQGQAIERQAQRFLERQGLQTLARNYRCRRGEIDLVMRDGETLAFVEVRYRGRNARGGAKASVDRRKQSRLITTALHYAQRHPRHRQRPMRFDVIAVDAAAHPPFAWLQDAFRP